MRVALAILCIGAVTFLLRVLAALVREIVCWPPSAIRVHFAKFNPSGRRGKLITMNPAAQMRNGGFRTDRRIAL
jgi:hypothetical protein